MFPDPPASCWLHEAVSVRTSVIQGRGLFATRPLTAGTEVSVLGGRLIDDAELARLIAAGAGYVDSITVAPDTNLLLGDGDARYGNHSCDPNLWWDGPYTLLARRDIASAEELTSDYATCTDHGEFVMPCSCGSPLCRRVVTGEDWRRPDLQSRYGRHWVPALLRRIRQQRFGGIASPRPPFPARAATGDDSG